MNQPKSKASNSIQQYPTVSNSINNKEKSYVMLPTDIPLLLPLSLSPSVLPVLFSLASVAQQNERKKVGQNKQEQEQGQGQGHKTDEMDRGRTGDGGREFSLFSLLTNRYNKGGFF